MREKCYFVVPVTPFAHAPFSWASRHTTVCLGTLGLRKRIHPPGGQMSVAPTRLGLPAVQSLWLEGFFSFFGPFLLHVICH